MRMPTEISLQRFIATTDPDLHPLRKQCDQILRPLRGPQFRQGPDGSSTGPDLSIAPPTEPFPGPIVGL